VFRGGRPAIRVFSTCPQTRDIPASSYARHVADVARWSEEAGCEGILIYTDNAIADPWLVAQLVVSATKRLCPLIAVQPLYLHPYSAAKMVATFAYLHDRRVYLNLVAGGFRLDLFALGDRESHDARYGRAIEYGEIIADLVRGRSVTKHGVYYVVENLKLAPAVPREHLPGMMMSGSSPAGFAAARALGATAVKYPRAPEDEDDLRESGVDCGIRIGIVTRETTEEAWRVALGRFPEDRAGQIAHQYAMQVSDSHWHRQLAQLAEETAARDLPYWLGPFENYKTFCPYLVGSYDRVADEISRYVALGFRTFILDIPPSSEELEHTGIAFSRARDSVPA
jgi:alkanesulfonate monooxygenase